MYQSKAFICIQNGVKMSGKIYPIDFKKGLDFFYDTHEKVGEFVNARIDTCNHPGDNVLVAVSLKIASEKILEMVTELDNIPKNKVALVYEMILKEYREVLEGGSIVN